MRVDFYTKIWYNYYIRNKRSCILWLIMLSVLYANRNLIEINIQRSLLALVVMLTLAAPAPCRRKIPRKKKIEKNLKNI